MRNPTGVGTMIALGFLAVVFLGGVWIGSHVTWVTLAARCGL